MKRITSSVNVGKVIIGGNNPIVIQSMTNTNTADVKATILQIQELEKAGCEVVRVAIPDDEAADKIKEIKQNINIPLVADIHFDYKLALKAIENGVDKLRINPGNIGSKERVKEVVRAAKERSIPIRIGVNSGSLEKELLEIYGGPTSEALIRSAMKHIEILEDMNFDDIVISLKASSVPKMIETYRMIADKISYPLHLGVTEAGTSYSGIIKSAIGIGTLLSEGIGDTIRVSLTANPVEEIRVAKEILKALEMRNDGINIISCPTCGRTKIDLINIAEKVQKRLQAIDKNLTVAIMGCAVNGPGEAREADIGIAGGDGVGLIFKKGQILKKVKEEDLIDELIEEIQKF